MFGDDNHQQEQQNLIPDLNDEVIPDLNGEELSLTQNAPPADEM